MPTEEIFSKYEKSHQHAGNRVLHIVGLPLVLFGILTALSWIRFPLGGFDLTPAVLLLTALLTWYFHLNARAGLAGLLLSLLVFFPADHAAAVSVTSGRIPGLAITCAAGGTGLVFLWLGHRWERSAFLPTERWVLLLVGPAYYILLFLRLVRWDGGLVDRWRRETTEAK